MKAFCTWFVTVAKRAAVNPLPNLKRVRVTEAEAKETRELEPEELAWLLAATAKAPARYNMEPAERVLLYRFAYETGIRPGQIRALTVSAFDLDADPPHVVSSAKKVKTRKALTQPLRPAMAALLKEKFENRLPQALAFPTMPDKFTCSEMFQVDLANARRLWIESAVDAGEERVKRGRSDFLAERDHHGRRAIFYSLRHSHGTALAEAGVPQKDIQASLNHTRSSTTDRYVKSGLRAKAKAVNALPAVLADAIVLSATGTGGGGPTCLPNAWPTEGTPANTGERKKPTPESGVGLISEGDGTRTRNHRIDSPVL